MSIDISAAIHREAADLRRCLEDAEGALEHASAEQAAELLLWLRAAHEWLAGWADRVQDQRPDDDPPPSAAAHAPFPTGTPMRRCF
jgi:hypothetical protein